MSYTGKVSGSDVPDVRELAELIITKLEVGDFGNNAYLLRCRRTDEQLLIDAAAEPERILRLVGSDGLTSVLTTHRHGDHWGALAEVVEATGATTYAGEHDAEEIPVRDRRPGRRRRHRPGRRVRAHRDPPGRSHPRVDRPPLRRPRRHAAPVHRRLPLPRRGRQHLRRPEGLSSGSTPTCAPSCSTGCPTRPGSTPATATTPRSAPNDPTSTTGRHAAGDRGLGRVTAGLVPPPQPLGERSPRAARAPRPEQPAIRSRPAPRHAHGHARRSVRAWGANSRSCGSAWCRGSGTSARSIHPRRQRPLPGRRRCRAWALRSRSRGGGPCGSEARRRAERPSGQPRASCRCGGCPASTSAWQPTLPRTPRS